MARYRHIDMSPRLLPVALQAQLVPGSFAHALHHRVDQLDLSAFDAHYRNDDNGAPAMLFKAVLLAYLQGIATARAAPSAATPRSNFVHRRPPATAAHCVRSACETRYHALTPARHTHP